MQRSCRIFKSSFVFEVNTGGLKNVQEMYYLMLASFFCICYWSVSQMGQTILSQSVVHFLWLFPMCCILVKKKVYSCHCTTIMKCIYKRHSEDFDSIILHPLWRISLSLPFHTFLSFPNLQCFCKICSNCRSNFKTV